MLICVFRQLALAKTDSQTKKRKEKTKSIQAAHANQTFSSHYIDRHLFLEKRKKMPPQTHTIDNSQANICLCGRLGKVKWIYVPHNVRKDEI